MNEITVSVVGNVASDVVFRKVGNGTSLSSFRLASSTRYYDKARREWADGSTTWFTVFCFRECAEHVSSSLSKGDPVVVTGRLTAREWEKEGRRGTSLEIEAKHLGHDLSRGSTAFKRRVRAARVDDTGGVLEEIGVALAVGSAAGESVPSPEDGTRDSGQAA
jgi:single-strand DNA-binding protein